MHEVEGHLSKRAKIENYSCLLEERDTLKRLIEAVDREDNTESKPCEPFQEEKWTQNMQRMAEGYIDADAQAFMAECTTNDIALNFFLRSSQAEPIFELLRDESESPVIAQFIAEITDRENDDNATTDLLLKAIRQSSLPLILTDKIVTFPSPNTNDANYLYILFCCVENILELDPGFYFKDARLLDALILRSTLLQPHALYASELLSILAENKRHLQFVTESSLSRVFHFIDQAVEREDRSLELRETTENLLNFTDICSLSPDTLPKMDRRQYFVALTHLIKTKSVFGYKALRIIFNITLGSSASCHALIEENFHVVLLGLLLHPTLKATVSAEGGQMGSTAIHILASMCLNSSQNFRECVVGALKSKEAFERLVQVYEDAKQQQNFVLLNDAAILISAVLAHRSGSMKVPANLSSHLVSVLNRICEETPRAELKEYVFALIEELKKGEAGILKET